VRTRHDKGLYREIGQNIRAIRDKRKMTQEQLADGVGLQRTSVTNIEAGRQKMLVDTLVLIAAQLGVDPGSLLPDVGPLATSPAPHSMPTSLSRDEAEFLQGAYRYAPAERRKRKHK
jgi:transcriptional regulator with XRE-family HTH domain